MVTLLFTGIILNVAQVLGLILFVLEYLGSIDPGG